MADGTPSSDDDVGSDLFWCWIRRRFLAGILCWNRFCRFRWWDEGVSGKCRLCDSESGEDVDDARGIFTLEMLRVAKKLQQLSRNIRNISQLLKPLAFLQLEFSDFPNRI
jgi:hypothetical protein